MPFIGIFGADAREIGAGSLGAPLERWSYMLSAARREVTVTLDLIAQRPDHLRVTKVAAFADVDVRRSTPAGYKADAIDHSDRALEVEQRVIHETAVAITARIPTIRISNSFRRFDAASE